MDYSLNGAKHRYRQLRSPVPKLFHLFTNSLLCLFIFGAVGTTVCGISFLRGAYKGIIDATPNISVMELRPNGYSSFVYDISGNQIAKLVTTDSNRVYVTIDKIPADLQHAFVAIEDRRFYEHDGIDIKGIIRAGVTAIKGGSLSQGASTITQQLIKNNVFTGWTDEDKITRIKRKLQEQQLALELEHTEGVTKDMILELYLNTINLGQNTLGVQAASLRYFNKDVSKLTLSEAAVLACIPQNPTKYNPITHPDKNKERREKVLGDMLEEGWITTKAYNEALADDVYSRITETNQNLPSSTQTYFVDALVEQILDDLQTQCGMTQQQAYYQLYSGGLSIYSSQDPEIQKVCDDFINNPDNFPSTTTYTVECALTLKDVSGNYTNLNENNFTEYTGQTYFKTRDDATIALTAYKQQLAKTGLKLVDERINIIPQPQISATIIDQSTGHVKAIIGGRGDKTESLTFNRATGALRQPGSTFKVVSTYLPALDGGTHTLASTQVDEPFNYENGTPVHNYYSGYKGTCTLRYGIEQSLNIVTVKTLTDITPRVGYDSLIKQGFTTLVDNEVKNGKTYSDVTQALALGGITYGVKNVELTNAYATIANLGQYHRYTFYNKVLDHDGNILLDGGAPQQIYKESTAYALISAMKDVITQGTGKAVNFEGQELAGKTGTTSNNKDVWFAGFTPYYTCAVWAGYDDNSILKTAEERALAKTTWKALMSKIHEELPYKQFRMPKTITPINICPTSHKRAKESCPNSYVEVFDYENVPDEVCTSSHYVAPARPATPTPATPQLTPEQQAALALWMQQQQAAAAAAQQQAAQ